MHWDLSNQAMPLFVSQCNVSDAGPGVGVPGDPPSQGLDSVNIHDSSQKRVLNKKRGRHRHQKHPKTSLAYGDLMQSYKETYSIRPDSSVSSTVHSFKSSQTIDIWNTD